MSDSPLTPAGSGNPISQQLTDRVIARVKDARLAVEGQNRTLVPKSRRRRAGDRDRLGGGGRTPAEQREARALRRVFFDLGQSYRSYRRRTGEPVAADVRDAAIRFRKDLDFNSLVSVAATLEQLDAMTW